MKKLQAVIVDDEQGALDVLNHLLVKSGMVDVLAKETDARKTESLIATYNPDILFLDVELTSLNGIDILAKIREYNQDLHVIMVTAHDRYAFKAVKYNVYSYLLKPVDRYELNTVIERLYDQKYNDFIPPITKIKLPIDGGYLFVKPDEICMMKVNGSGTEIVTSQAESYKSSYRMGRLLERLPEDGFLRINRDTVLNNNYLHCINKEYATCVVHLNDQKFKFDLSNSFMKTCEAML